MSTDNAAFERRLSPDAVSRRGTASVLLIQIRSEFLKTLRALDFTAAVVLLPVVLFLLFGVPNSRQELPDGQAAGPHLVASFGAYGMLGLVLFAFGEGIAVERGQGWLRLVRATPLHPAVYFAAKLVVATLVGVLILALLFPVAVVMADVRLDLSEWFALGLTLLLAALTLAPIGFLIGFWARPGSAGAISLLLLLPVSYLSGLWQPIPLMPEALQETARFLPTYYYAELARTTLGIANEEATHSLAWLVITAMIFGAVAVWGYRREVARQFA